jgi:hypothetical protein
MTYPYNSAYRVLTGRSSECVSISPPLKARKRAKQIQGSVAHGGDPVKEERKKKAEAHNTLKAVADEYLRREEKKGELRSIAAPQGVP